ncbi:hypothetical protein AB0N87_38560 [Streptomyces sp. NPDC093228]|uniref:ABC transporter substrate-binding protein n=1 Tax=unclassified Streptomyces TaxID=2593676 RepID=UPI000740F26E|nr:hypothetical protein [Streptomyces sp. NRRL F-5122]KUJ35922.1 hypothetical protein ADL25_34780 [Streptomyces sp. NRRL F-5122]
MPQSTVVDGAAQNTAADAMTHTAGPAGTPTTRHRQRGARCRRGGYGRLVALGGRARYGTAPVPWAAEAYDAVRFAAHGLTAAGDYARSAVRSELLRHSWQGITRRISYDPDSQFFEAVEDAGAFLYRVTDHTLRFVSRADDIGRTT